MKMSLSQAPNNKPLRIVEITGGYGMRRRLLSLGLHKNDIIELDSKSILGGPLLITDITSDTSVALGRGIAHKIMVETVGKE